MSTSIELKEMMKTIKQQQKAAEKEINKTKKEFHTWKTLMSKHSSFAYAFNFQDKYDSFEELIIEQKWSNAKINKVEFEFLFTQLGFTDSEFFSTFMGWDKAMFAIPIEDRKCSICLSYYNSKTKPPKKFANCIHKVCTECYTHIRNTNGFKCCVICRKSEECVIVVG